MSHEGFETKRGAITRLPERRRGPRLRTVYRIAMVRSGDRIGLWRVHNISDHGLMLAGGSARAGDRLDISLSETKTLSGSVMWAADGRCGVQFYVPIDCASLLRHLVAERRAPAYRPPRLALAAPAVVHADHGASHVQIVNLSQQGMGIAHDGEFHPGMTAKIQMPDGTEYRGRICWPDAERASVQLREIIPAERLQ